MKSPENPGNPAFMREALKEAEKAYRKGEVPVGAVVVRAGRIIARAHNLREHKQSVHGHAEFLALMKAAKKCGTWRLEDCDVYVTMEPCPMCAGAMLQARVHALFYGAKDPKAGVINSLFNMFDLPFNHKPYVESGLLAEESSALLKAFFKELRKNK
jgi:tRNA(adenine34) deaminase